MRVAITGATGFVGGHVLRRLVEAGHEPVALVRDPAKLSAVMALHSIAEVDSVVGDLADDAAIARLVDGCDACIHLAANTSMASGSGEDLNSTNVGGGARVLDAAVAAGCRPVVHLSSVAAIFPPTGDVLRATDPVTQPEGDYSRSKADLDRYARSLQDNGAPVVIVYPGGVIGPTEIGVSVVADGISRMLNSGVLAFPEAGGNVWIDVRDLALVLERLLDVGAPGGRYMAGGNFLPWDDLVALLAGVSERRPDIQRPANEALKAMAVEAERAAAQSGTAPLLDLEAVTYMCDAVPSDDTELLTLLGMTWRDVTGSWHDTMSWWSEAGLLE